MDTSGSVKKRRKRSAAAAGENQSVPPGVATIGQTHADSLYDDVVLQQEVELKENVAYGPLR